MDNKAHLKPLSAFMQSKKLKKTYWHCFNLIQIVLCGSNTKKKTRWKMDVVASFMENNGGTKITNKISSQDKHLCEEKKVNILA